MAISNGEFWPIIKKLFNIPDSMGVVDFTLDCKLNSTVTITMTYYPNLNYGEDVITETFILAKKQDDKDSD